MKLLSQLSKMFKRGNKFDDTNATIEETFVSNDMSGKELFQKLQDEPHAKSKQLNYHKLNRGDYAVLFVQTNDEGEDISVVEFVSCESFLKLDVEDEVWTMGDFLTKNGISIDELVTKRVAIVAVCDTELPELLAVIQQSTYEDPTGFPPQSSYNLTVCACVIADCGKVVFSPATKFLKKEYLRLSNDVLALITF